MFAFYCVLVFLICIFSETDTNVWNRETDVFSLISPFHNVRKKWVGFFWRWIMCVSVFLYLLCTFCKSQKVSLYRPVRLQDSVVRHFAHFLFCFIFSFSPRLWFSKNKVWKADQLLLLLLLWCAAVWKGRVG